MTATPETTAKLRILQPIEKTRDKLGKIDIIVDADWFRLPRRCATLVRQHLADDVPHGLPQIKTRIEHAHCLAPRDRSATAAAARISDSVPDR